jgi:acyl CoA:acetate/3-ketoacid CoA transferase beta subunit
VYTGLAVLEPRGSYFQCLELGPGVDEQMVRQQTGADVRFGVSSAGGQ